MDAINTTKFSLQLYELIRSRTDEDTAKKAVEAVEGIVEQKSEQKLSGVATKQDIYLLKEDIGRIKEDIVRVETKVATKDDIISLQRWLLGTMIVLVVMVLGLYFKKA